MVNTISSHWLGLYLRRFVIAVVTLSLIFSAAFLSAGDTPLKDRKDALIPIQDHMVKAISQTDLPAKTTGHNLKDCLTKLTDQGAGWCEIYVTKQHPSISSVWPKNLDKKTRMTTGPVSILTAWNSAAFDKEKRIFYFFGGGHADYGGNEVYRFELDSGKWRRLTDPSPLDHLFVAADYNKRPEKPWRRLCWVTDVRKVPASTHTYDGLIFSHTTKTIFLYNMGAATGSCIEDTKDIYNNKTSIIVPEKTTKGWYEFNPSPSESVNGLKPLSWRKVFDSDQLKKMSIHQGYSVSVELKNGLIAFGSRWRTAIYDPAKPTQNTLRAFTYQADWGDGTKQYDHQRNIIWSLHSKILLGFDANNGQLIRKIEAKVPHGKSLAIDKKGRILSWNGKSKIYSVVVDKEAPYWKEFDWGEQGPQAGDGRVYGKWVYLPKQDVFVGLSSHKTGVWVYKHSDRLKETPYSNINPQSLIDKAPAGSNLTIPPGIYGQGLLINKSITLKLDGVSLRGVANNKGIINVNCDGCEVILEDFHADGRKANCLWGNCAGIKAEGIGFNLKVVRAHIDNTVMGILTDNRGGTLVLEDSLIENTGWKDRSQTLGHGFYAGNIDKVIIRNSTIRRSFGDGHLVKSRAKETLIKSSVIAGLDGLHSRVLDFPCGGQLVIQNSVLQQGVNTDNTDLISVGTEPDSCQNRIHPTSLSVTGSWIIFDRDASTDERSANYGDNRLLTWRAPQFSANLSGNNIIESTGRLKIDENNKAINLGLKNQFYKSRLAAGIGATEIPALLH